MYDNKKTEVLVAVDTTTQAPSQTKQINTQNQNVSTQQNNSSTKSKTSSVPNSLVVNVRYGYQFSYDPSLFKVALVGTKFDPEDYLEVHINTIPLSNPGNPFISCFGRDSVSEGDFYLINSSSSITTNYSNQNQLSVIKTVKEGQQNHALFPGEKNTSSLELYSYTISNGSRTMKIVVGCQGSHSSDADRAKYGFMTSAQEDAWIKNVGEKLDNAIMTFKFI